MTHKHIGRKIKGLAARVKLQDRRDQQTTFCYCPICDNELINSHSLKHDKPDDVRFVCKECGCESMWNFDIAPVPLLMKAQRLTNRLYKYERKTLGGES